MTRGLRIVRLANFVAPSSGGLRTALRHLGAGYLAAGHEPVLVIPGPRREDRWTPQGRVITLPGPVVPGSGGYRVLVDRRRLSALLGGLRPDRLEVSDRSTLRWTGAWARRHGVPAAMVSHESLDGLLKVWGLPDPAAGRLADRLNARTARDFRAVICTTDWAAAEFRRIGTGHLVHAPLGVDLERWHPGRRSAAERARWTASGSERLIVMCSRLSPEKRPGTALDALAELLRAGERARLVVAGEGPLRARLEARARAERLPVTFAGFLRGEALPRLLAAADAVIAPGPVETFGLAALEALASGTPVAVSPSSALPGVVAEAGAAAAADTGAGFAEAVTELLTRPEAERRAAARARAECFPWSAAVDAFLAAHGAAPAAAHDGTSVVGRAPAREAHAQPPSPGARRHPPVFAAVGAPGEPAGAEGPPWQEPEGASAAAATAGRAVRGPRRGKADAAEPGVSEGAEPASAPSGTAAAGAGASPERNPGVAGEAEEPARHSEVAA